MIANICFAQLHGTDGETVEAAASTYSKGELLPEGQWSVLKANSDSEVVMSQEEMPIHWQEEIKRWNAWAVSHLPCSETMD